MVTTAELNRRGLRYAVVVDGAATPASLQALDRQGLPYLVEVADGATMASRRALEGRGLRYLVPVLVDATPASKASLAAQGLRYAVQVDADILPADRLVLQRQGLACYVEVDSSGNSVSAAAVGGAALLTGEANGFAADFTHPVDAERVAVKTAGTVVSSGTSFFTSSGTSSKWVYDVNGTLVNIPVGTLPLDYDPVTHAALGLKCEPAATNLYLQAQTQDNATWVKSAGTVSANAIAAPDGTTTADGYVPNSGTVDSHLSQSSLPLSVGQPYTLSFYIKNGTLGNNWLQLLINQSSSISTYFNLSTGAIGTSTGTTTTRTITAVGNGWFKIIVTYTASDATFSTYWVARGSDGGSTVSGNGTAPAYYLWGAQLEAGTVATSYIPTLAATVTRAVDNYFSTPTAIGYSATAGSWWVEHYSVVGPTVGALVGSTSLSNALALFYGDVHYYGMFDTTALYKTVGAPNVVGNINRVACAFQTGDRVITARGMAPDVDAGTVTTMLAPVQVMFGNAAGGSPMAGWIRKLRYLPRRPSNAELTAMTT